MQFEPNLTIFNGWRRCFTALTCLQHCNTVSYIINLLVFSPGLMDRFHINTPVGRLINDYSKTNIKFRLNAKQEHLIGWPRRHGCDSGGIDLGHIHNSQNNVKFADWSNKMNQRQQKNICADSEQKLLNGCWPLAVEVIVWGAKPNIYGD